MLVSIDHPIHGTSRPGSGFTSLFADRPPTPLRSGKVALDAIEARIGEPLGEAARRLASFPWEGEPVE